MTPEAEGGLRRRWTWILLLCLLVGNALRPRPGPALPAENLRPHFDATAGPVVLSVSGEGTVEPAADRSITVPSELGSCRVERILPEGTQVKKGQPVVLLSTFQMVQDQRAALLDQHLKEGELTQLLRDNKAAELEEKKKISDQEAELSYQRVVLAFQQAGADRRKLASLAIKIRRAQVEEAYQSSQLAIQKVLMEKGIVQALSYADSENFTAKVRITRAQQENQLLMEKEGATPDEREKTKLLVKKLEVQVDLAKRSSANQDKIRALNVEKKKAEVQQFRAKVEDLERKKKLATLRATADGVILLNYTMWNSMMSAGASVEGGTSILKVVDQRELRAKIKIGERWVDRIKVGQIATVFVANCAAPIHASVETIGRVEAQMIWGGKGKRNALITLKLKGDLASLRLNMSCVGHIQLAGFCPAYRVPIDALVHREKAKAQWLAWRDGREVQIDSTVLDEDPDHLFVTGLSGRERLLYARGATK
jgi:HlyD family secretion protein